jgi:hypothetical protein
MAINAHKSKIIAYIRTFQTLSQVLQNKNTQPNWLGILFKKSSLVIIFQSLERIVRVFL